MHAILGSLLASKNLKGSRNSQYCDAELTHVVRPDCSLISGFTCIFISHESIQSCTLVPEVFFSLGATELSRDCESRSGEKKTLSRRSALLTLTFLAAGEREDLWHPGYQSCNACCNVFRGKLQTIHSFFSIRIYFIRISRLKFAKF